MNLQVGRQVQMPKRAWVLSDKLGSPVVPFSLCFGSRFPYEVLVTGLTRRRKRAVLKESCGLKKGLRFRVYGSGFRVFGKSLRGWSSEKLVWVWDSSVRALGRRRTKKTLNHTRNPQKTPNHTRNTKTPLNHTGNPSFQRRPG